MSEATGFQPYRGIRVIDISQGIAGPWGASLLGQYGADVVKVEPLHGDWGRVTGFGIDGMTGLVLACNAAKRSIAIDLTREEGRALVHRLVEAADIFVENNRPGISERLGVGYPALSALNPRLIYLSISGFGQTGEAARRPATDSLIQAHTGLMVRNGGPGGPPKRVPMFLPDTVTALNGAHLMAAALVERATTGKGRHIDLTLTQATAAFQSIYIADQLVTGDRPPIPFTVPAGEFETADGMVVMNSVNESHWKRITQALGHPEWADDPRFADLETRACNAAVLLDLVWEVVRTPPTVYWLDRFAACDVIGGPVQDYAGYLADDHARATGRVADIDQPGVGTVARPIAPALTAGDAAAVSPAPRLGAEGREILEDCGVDAAEIDRLIADGVVGAPVAA